MTTTTSRTTTTAQPTSLRTRIAQLAQAQAMKDIQATAACTVQRTAPQLPVAKRATVTQLHSTAQRYAIQRDAALQQAKNNLATANWIAQGNSALGRALQRLAMCDMNSLRAKNATAKQCSVVAEYSNIGRFWE